MFLDNSVVANVIAWEWLLFFVNLGGSRESDLRRRESTTHMYT